MTRAGYHDPFRTLTRRQIEVIYGAIAKEQRQRRAEMITDMNAAHHGGESANRLLKSLRK